MNNLNSILIEGNLVKDPELSYTSKGTAVCKFTVACNRAFKQDDQLQKEDAARGGVRRILEEGPGSPGGGQAEQNRWTRPMAPRQVHRGPDQG
jgi:Single-strand binding protein family